MSFSFHVCQLVYGTITFSNSVNAVDALEQSPQALTSRWQTGKCSDNFIFMLQCLSNFQSMMIPYIRRFSTYPVCKIQHLPESSGSIDSQGPEFASLSFKSSSGKQDYPLLRGPTPVSRFLLMHHKSFEFRLPEFHLPADFAKALNPDWSILFLFSRV